MLAPYEKSEPLLLPPTKVEALQIEANMHQ